MDSCLHRNMVKQPTYLLLFASLVFGLVVAGPFEGRKPVSENDLTNAIASITDKNKPLTYSLRGWVNAKGLVRMEKGHEDEPKGLACSSFASAVLHRIQQGSFKGISTKIHTTFGGEKLASHYKLGSPVDLKAVKVTPPESRTRVKLDDFRSKYSVKQDRSNRANRKSLAGVYLFELTREGVPNKDGVGVHRAHVGFLVISEAKVRQIHFSALRHYKGYADDTAFFEKFVDESCYNTKKPKYGKERPLIRLWRVSTEVK